MGEAHGGEEVVYAGIVLVFRPEFRVAEEAVGERERGERGGGSGELVYNFERARSLRHISTIVVARSVVSPREFESLQNRQIPDMTITLHNITAALRSILHSPIYRPLTLSISEHV